MPKSRQNLKGKLLLDGGQLAGSWFHRSVVLVCEHNEQGAFGLVLNRLSDSRVDEVLDAEVGEVIGSGNLQGGGPVQPSALSFLQKVGPGDSPPVLPQSLVIPGIVLGHQLEDLVEIGKSSPEPGSVRVFAGYAGWSPGQLESELKREAWLIVPATIEWVFQAPSEGLWRQILKRQKDWKKRLLGDSPEDLSWN